MARGFRPIHAGQKQQAGVSIMFHCDQCGECCRNLDKSPLYKDLDRGDGVCRYLCGNLCSIYETRPLLCRVDACYELFFQELVSRDEFYEMNYRVCRKFKKHL